MSYKSKGSGYILIVYTLPPGRHRGMKVNPISRTGKQPYAHYITHLLRINHGARK